MNNKPSLKPVKSKPESTWPRFMLIKPKTVLVIIAIWLVVAWLIFLAIDIFAWIDIELSRPAWTFLFNDRPVEWTQWFLLAFAVAAAGYLAGRLESQNQAKAARFFFLLAIGLGLMLIEDAGDIRHVLNREVERVIGPKIFGVRHSFVVELPYFLAVASVPLYALIRYGRYAWQSIQTRFYLATGFILYGLAAAGSTLSNLAHSYVIVGALIDIAVFGNRLPLLPGRSQGFTYFMFVDSAVEESIELLAIAMLLAAILAFASDVRTKRFPAKKQSN